MAAKQTKKKAAAAETRDENLVRALYQAILEREPSQDEVSRFTGYAREQRYFDLVKLFVTSEEANDAAASKARAGLYVPLGHYYSPIVDTDELRRMPPVTADVSDPTIPGLRIDRQAMLEFWQASRGLLAQVPFTAKKTEGLRYCCENPSYSYGDAIVLYLMLRTYQPRRIIEIGSGYSSACMLDTIDRHLRARTSLTCIEPYPELLLSLISAADRKRVHIIGKPIQQVGLETFDQLRTNDILFIDSTHVVKTGSDVVHEVFNILPFLHSGVLIHFHDIFYPFEYPPAWIYDDKRSWNELYLIRAFLMHNTAFEIVFFNDYFERFFFAEIAKTRPDYLKNSGGGLWLRKLSPAAKRRRPA